MASGPAILKFFTFRKHGEHINNRKGIPVEEQPDVNAPGVVCAIANLVTRFRRTSGCNEDTGPELPPLDKSPMAEIRGRHALAGTAGSTPTKPTARAAGRLGGRMLTCVAREQACEHLWHGAATSPDSRRAEFGLPRRRRFPNK
jgi:hypothetical protein